MSELSTSEFKSIVDAVAAERRITSVSISGFEVTFMVLSNSGKGSWQARCDFDPRTGDVGLLFATYPESKELYWFATEVARRIRARA